MVKAYLCHKTKLDVWGQVQLAGLELLTCSRLEWYSEFIPDKGDSQEECVVAVDDPGKYVSVLVGQCNNEEQQAVSNRQNLESVDKLTLCFICKTSLLTTETKVEMLRRLRMFASNQSEEDRWRQLGKRGRVKSNLKQGKARGAR